MRTEPGFQFEARAPEALRGCVALWGEVLRVAIEDARGGSISGLKFVARPGGSMGNDQLGFDPHEQARRWIGSDDIAPCSFTWCCSLFDLDPSTVRRALVERKKTARARASSMRSP